MKSWHCPVALSPDTQMSHWWQLSLLSDRTCAPWFGWDDNSILHGWLHTSCSREHQICCGAHGGEGGEGECDRVTADWISSMYFILSLPPPPSLFFFPHAEWQMRAGSVKVRFARCRQDVYNERKQPPLRLQGPATLTLTSHSANAISIMQREIICRYTEQLPF